MKAILYFDGSCSGNPGPGGWGFVIITEGGDKVEGFGGDPDTTNNKMEYTALLKGMEKALEIGIRELEIKGDSQLVVNQVTGQYKVKNAQLVPLFQKAVSLLRQFDKVEVRWIERSKNIADKLARQGTNLALVHS